jgi:hypothetical protein
MAEIFKNNFAVTLASGVDTDDVEWTLSTGHGDLFPTLSGGDYIRMTAAVGFPDNETSWEVVKVTDVTGDVITVVRAQDNTTAQSWSSSTTLQHRATADALSGFMQAANAALTGEMNAADQTVKRAVLKDYAETRSTPTDSGGTTTVNFEAGNVAHITLTTDTTIAFSNPPSSGVAAHMTLIFDQDGTGGWTVTMPGSVTKGALNLNLNASKRTIATLITLDGGSSYTLMNSFKET